MGTRLKLTRLNAISDKCTYSNYCKKPQYLYMNCIDKRANSLLMVCKITNHKLLFLEKTEVSRYL